MVREDVFSWGRRRLAVSILMAVMLSACGPSDQEVFDQALADGRAALQSDDLDAARSHLLVAEDAMPGSPTLLAAIAELEAITASQNAFLEAELLRLEPAASIEAILLYQSVLPVDTRRFNAARLAAEELEHEWAAGVGREVDRLLDTDEVEQIAPHVLSARRSLPSSSSLQVELDRVSESVLAAAEVSARALIGNGALDPAERLLREILSVFSLSESAASDQIREMQAFIPNERERLARGTVNGCPTPSPRDRLWEECLNRRALAETGCPSVIYDAEAAERCLFGQENRQPAATAPTQQAPTVPTVPDESMVPVVPDVPASCSTFDPGISVSVGTVSGAVSTGAFGSLRVEIEFDGTVTNSSSGWMKNPSITFVFYTGAERERHPGHRVQLTALDGVTKDGWAAPGSVQRFTQSTDLLGNFAEPPTHVEFMAVVSLREENPPAFCNPNGQWSGAEIRAPISY